MARGMKITGLEELIKKVEGMGKRPEGLVKRSLYAGAGMMSDAVKSAVGSLPVDEEFGTKNHKRDAVTAVQKAGLVSGVGISHMQEEGGAVSVVIGFAGENADGEKNTTVMRRVESGTSRTQKHPVIRQTKNRTKAASIAAMQKQFEEDIKELFE